MKKYTISIPTPCTENWDQMTSTDNGKHCASCNKVVVDFTNMSNQQILTALLLHKGKKVCGNFYNTQIEKPILHISTQTKTKWPAIAAMLVAGLFQLTSSHVYAQNQRIQMTRPTSIQFEEKGEKKTEPAKDSLIDYSIKVLSTKGKNIISGAIVTIDGIGNYITDNKGMIHFSVAENKIPDTIHIQLSAVAYNNEDIQIQKSNITKANKIELWMTEQEVYMLRGDISIEEHR